MIEYRARAVADVESIADFISLDNPDAGQRFIDAFLRSARSAIHRTSDGSDSSGGPIWRGCDLGPLKGSPTTSSSIGSRTQACSSCFV